MTDYQKFLLKWIAAGMVFFIMCTIFAVVYDAMGNVHAQAMRTPQGLNLDCQKCVCRMKCVNGVCTIKGCTCRGCVNYEPTYTPLFPTSTPKPTLTPTLQPTPYPIPFTPYPEVKP